MSISRIGAGSVACITGGASGIGKAAAQAWAARGLDVALIDFDADALAAAKPDVDAVGPGRVAAFQADITDPDRIRGIEAEIAEMFGGTDVLMNNAGIGRPSSVLDPANWRKVVETNLWGIIDTTQIFAARMVERGRPGLIINTGSKQGITTPPGNPCYNMSKAAVKAFTEALAHELRNTAPHLGAHLLVPGFVFTGMTRGDRTDKPPSAWTPEQTVEFMLQSLEHGDFYILCPDNDVPRAIDEKRIAWAAGDLIKNRPALSRWHPDYADAFAAHMDRSLGP